MNNHEVWNRRRADAVKNDNGEDVDLAHAADQIVAMCATSAYAWCLLDCPVKDYPMWCKAWPNERERAYALVWHAKYRRAQYLYNHLLYTLYDLAQIMSNYGSQNTYTINYEQFVS